MMSQKLTLLPLEDRIGNICCKCGTDKSVKYLITEDDSSVEAYCNLCALKHLGTSPLRLVSENKISRN